jgi:hypothetical protein
MHNAYKCVRNQSKSFFKPMLEFIPSHPIQAWSRLTLELIKALTHRFHAEVIWMSRIGLGQQN